MTIYFITGNQNKFAELRVILPDIEMLSIDLVEIQESDASKIIEAKLREARLHHNGAFIVEDTSLHFECLGGLPGPFIKWFLEKLKPEGLYKLAQSMGAVGARARTLIGYSDETGKIMFFEGVTDGVLVPPRGKTDFGWDPIFQPTGSEKTYAEMTREEKNAVSHRGKAVSKLAAFLSMHGSIHR